MKKKGFTLVELLAVIIVLAIIALIATPIVMNAIKSTEKGAAETSANSYIRAVDLAMSNSELKKKFILDGSYSIDSDGNLIGTGLPDGKLEIEMSGNKPTSGTVKIENGKVVKTGTMMIIGEYDVSYDETDKKYIAIKLGTYSITYNLRNVIGDSSNVTSISTKDVKTLKFASNDGYTLPDSVTVNGARSVWDKAAGTLTLSRVTRDVTVTIVGEKLLYVNGEIVYFNVTTGEKCSSSDYTETQSSTGVKEGCMKFYAFNDNGGNTINLILDHNTTATVAWNSSGSNASGPKEVLTQLKSDTSSWKGTETPANYTMDQASQTSKASYTVDYSGYKARLITAQEIATITGNTTWNEKLTAKSLWYYLDTNTTSASSTCQSGNTSGCQYGWLYDRTKPSCTTYGCLNNSDKSTSGYWTISSRAGDTKSALNMYYHAFLYFTDVNTSNYVGVRPVITVLKSKLS